VVPGTKYLNIKKEKIPDQAKIFKLNSFLVISKYKDLNLAI